MLNADLIRRRRQELGISERELARQIDGSIGYVRGIEGGRDNGEMSLAMLDRLADALAVKPNELLEREPSEGGCRSSSCDEAAERDAAIVGAFLFDVRRLVAIATIATALKWTTARTESAVTALSRRLAGTGLVVHRLRNEISLRTDALAVTPAAAASLLQQETSHRPLTDDDASALFAVAAGSYAEQHAGSSGRKACYRLLRMGLVDSSLQKEHLGGRQFVALTERVRYSLVLDD